LIEDAVGPEDDPPTTVTAATRARQDPLPTLSDGDASAVDAASPAHTFLVVLAGGDRLDGARRLQLRRTCRAAA
jgi:hypothetical protein